MNIFARMKAWLRWYAAVTEAERAHARTGARYYVMPKGEGAKLIIMDRYNFRRFKLKGYIDRRAKVADLEKDCFYCTPHRDGSGRLPDDVTQIKRDMYWKWVEYESEIRKAVRAAASRIKPQR